MKIASAISFIVLTSSLAGQGHLQIAGSLLHYHRGEANPSTVFKVKTSSCLEAATVVVECNPCRFSDGTWGVEVASWDGREFRSMYSTVDSYEGGEIDKGKLRNWIGRRSSSNTNIIGGIGDFFASGHLLFPQFVEFEGTGLSLVDLLSNTPEMFGGERASVEHGDGSLKIQTVSSRHVITFDPDRGLFLFPKLWRSEYLSGSGSAKAAMIVETRWGRPVMVSWNGIELEVPGHFERRFVTRDSDGTENEVSRYDFQAEQIVVEAGDVALPDWFHFFAEDAPFDQHFLMEEHLR